MVFMRYFVILSLILYSLNSFADQKTDVFKIGKPDSEADKSLEFITNNPNESFKIRANVKDQRLQFSNDGVHYSDFMGHNTAAYRYNLVSINSDFEQGISGWKSSAHGVLSVTKGPEEAIYGNHSGVFKPSAENQWIETHPNQLPKALRNNKCEASLYYATEEKEYTVQIITDNKEQIPLLERALAPTSKPKQVSLYFTCPDQGKLKLRILSNKAKKELLLDRVFLGELEVRELSRSDAAFAGGVQYKGCSWRIGSSTGQRLVYNCDQAPIYSGNASSIYPNESGPSVKFSALPAGYYFLFVQTRGLITFQSGEPSPPSSFCRYELFGDNSLQSSFEISQHRTIMPVIFKSEHTFLSPGDHTFSISVNPRETGTCHLSGPADDLHIYLYRLASLDETPVFNMHQTGWKLQGSMAGTNFNLGLAPSPNRTDWRYEEILATDQVNFNALPQSITAQALIQDDKKLPGIVFTPESMGELKACASFNHTLAVAPQSDILTRFKLAAVPSDNIANKFLTQVSNDTVTHRVTNLSRSDNKTQTTSFQLCSTFYSKTTTPIALRLVYEQDILSGKGESIKQSQILSEFSRLGSPIQWEVRPQNEKISTPLFTHTVSSSFEQGSRVESAVFDTTKESPEITQETGNWLKSISKVSTGDWNILFKESVFAAPPICTITPHSANKPIIVNIFESNSNYLRFKAWSIEQSIDPKFNLFCHGVRKIPL
jgi:hypothetical protein